MKYIKKYTIFESKILGTREKYLNSLIDEKGVLHKRKGFIINVKRNDPLTKKLKLTVLIVDSEWTYENDTLDKEKNIEHEYIAGIDMNGYIIGFNFDEKTDELKNSKGEVVYQEPGKPWKRNSNIQNYKFNLPEYSNIIDNSSTGWVNVKIDKEVARKVDRFSKRLSRREGAQALRDKLNKLTNPLGVVIKKELEDYTEITQQKLSALLILKYLEEIKEKFNATSSGFLFESFIAGLLGGNVPDDNSNVDIVSKNGKTTYQVKLFDWMSDSGSIRLLTPENIEVEEEKDGKIIVKKQRISKNHLEIWRDRKELKKQKLFCDFYIIGLKQNNKIFIYVISQGDLGNYLTTSGVSLSKLRDYVMKPGETNICFELNLNDLENKIKDIGDNIKNSLSEIWTNLSEVEYNVESITTGQNKEGGRIEPDDYERLFIESTSRLQLVTNEINGLKNSMSKPK